MYKRQVAAIALPFAFVFLQEQSFPKACALQDAHVGLCVPGTYDNATEACALDRNNRYYAYFKDAAYSGCEAYPRCVCRGEAVASGGGGGSASGAAAAAGAPTPAPSSVATTAPTLAAERSISVGACGAFARHGGAPWTVLGAHARDGTPWAVGFAYDLLSNHALVVWCVAAALYLAFLFRSNSVAVLVDLTAERERNWQAEVASQNARMRSLASRSESATK